MLIDVSYNMRFLAIPIFIATGRLDEDENSTETSGSGDDEIKKL